MLVEDSMTISMIILFSLPVVSALSGALIGSVLEHRDAVKNHRSSLDISSVSRTGSFFYLIAHIIGIVLLVSLSAESDMGWTFGIFILLMVGIIPLLIFSWIVTIIVAHLTGRKTVNTGGPTVGL